MNVWDRYAERLSAQGSTLRENKLNRLQRRIRNNLEDSLSYSKVTISGEEREVSIIRSSEGMDFKTLISMPNESFDRGSLVFWEDNYWLIISHDVQDEVYTRATIQQCNYLLTWINDEGEIIERHCIVTNNDRNSAGEREATDLTIGDNRLNLILAKDDETKKIYRGKRFLIDDPDAQGNILAYEVTKPDRLPSLYNGKGVYTFGLRECNTSAADNTELMIADYDLYINSAKKEPTRNGCELFLYSENNVIILNECSDIYIKITQNGDKIDDVVFNYEFLEGKDLVSVINVSDNKITLRAGNDSKDIGKVVMLRVYSDDYNISADIKLTIGGWT